MLLQLDAIRKLAGNRVIIEKASLSADQGEILCFAGPSGIGKTTLLEVIAGIVAPLACPAPRPDERRNAEAP